MATRELLKIRAFAEAERARRLQAPDPLRVILSDANPGVFFDYPDSHNGSSQLPAHLHAAQRRLIFDCQAKHRFLFGGNQVGKSSAAAIDLCLLALGRHPNQRWEPPVTCWASALTWDLWEDHLLPEIVTWLPPDRVIDAPPPRQKSDKRVIKVRADNGAESIIEGKSAEQGREKYQAFRIHHVLLDEEHPEAIWDEIMPRLVRFGGTTLTVLTPVKGQTWIAQRYFLPWEQGALNPDVVQIVTASTSENPGLTKAELALLEEQFEHSDWQRQARLHGRPTKPVGLVLPQFDSKKHRRRVSADERAKLLEQSELFAGVDFGLWRFAFLLLGALPGRRVWVPAEYFSQRENIEKRAKRMHEILTHHEAPHHTPVWGDSANPQDIMELNLALERMGSAYRVEGVAPENKVRIAGVTRFETLLARDDGFLVPEDVGADSTWYVGLQSGKRGTPVQGSRLVWEIENWSWKQAKEGQTQADDPNDRSADGADMVSAGRYALCSFWDLAQWDTPEEDVPFEPGSPSWVAARARKAELGQNTGRLPDDLPEDPMFGTMY